MSGRNVLPAKGGCRVEGPVGLPCMLFLPWHLYDPLSSWPERHAAGGNCPARREAGRDGQSVAGLDRRLRPARGRSGARRRRANGRPERRLRRVAGGPGRSPAPWCPAVPRLVRRSRGLSHGGFDDLGLPGRPAAGQGGRPRGSHPARSLRAHLTRRGVSDPRRRQGPRPGRS